MTKRRGSACLILAFSISLFSHRASADFFWQPSVPEDQTELWRDASSSVLVGISEGYQILALLELQTELGEAVVNAIDGFEKARASYQELAQADQMQLPVEPEVLLSRFGADVDFAINVFLQNGYDIPSDIGDVVSVAIAEVERAIGILSSVRDRVSFSPRDKELFDEIIALNSRLSRLGEASGVFLRVPSF